MKVFQQFKPLDKTIRIALLFVFCLLTYVNADAGPGSQEITIKLESLQLKQAIQETEKQTVLRFLYNEAVIPDDKKVSITAHNMPVDEFLNKMFNGTGIGYKIMENNLVVLTTPKITETAVPDKLIQGKVTDENGAPLNGVSITVKGTQQGTVTDATGNFSISVPDQAILVISFVGYQSQEVSVATRTDFNIVLAQVIKSQEQIVVIGYGTARKKDLTGSSVNIREMILLTCLY